MTPHWLFARLLLVLAPPAMPQVLQIGSWDRDSDPLTRASEAVMAKAYADVEQPVAFVDLPIRRALFMLLGGELDGNLHRKAELDAPAGTLVRIDTPINATQVRAYTRDPALTTLSWATLAGKRVGFRRGVLIIEMNLPPAAVRAEAKSEAEVLRMLASGMIDVGLAAEPSGYALPDMASKLHLRRLDGALVEIPLFHYLHARHQGLAVRLDRVLKRMQANGEIDAIRQRAMTATSPQH